MYGDKILKGEPYSFIEPYEGPARKFCVRHPPKQSDLTTNEAAAEAYRAQEHLESEWEDCSDATGLIAAAEAIAQQAVQLCEEKLASMEEYHFTPDNSEVAQQLDELKTNLEEFSGRCDSVKDDIEQNYNSETEQWVQEQLDELKDSLEVPM